MNFDVSELDAGDIVKEAMDETLDNWNVLWTSTAAAIEKLLVSYEKDHTLEEIVSDPTNTINVAIMPPEGDGDEKFLLDVSIDVKTEHGSFVYSAEFVGLEFVDSSATF